MEARRVELPTGRWKKKYKGKTYYFPGGTKKTDKEAYQSALAEWEKLKPTIDASLPKPHQADYERAIREWERVLAWCRKHPGEDDMAHTALSKLHSLRRQFAAAKPKPVPRSDTFDGHFDRLPCPAGLTEAIAALDRSWALPEEMQQLLPGLVGVLRANLLGDTGTSPMSFQQLT